jgi:prophage regulatory protein
MERLKGIKMSILRMPEVKAKTGHRSHASIYNAIRQGLFTRPVQIGLRSVGWPVEEVLSINAARIAGKTEFEIRQLVAHLHEQRIEQFAEIVNSHG